MKKQILKRILILIIPVFLFLGSQEAKADTFTWIDFNTWANGGAGFDGCGCHTTYLLQTDKPTYSMDEIGYISMDSYNSSNVLTPITSGGIKIYNLEGYPMNYTALPYSFRVGYDVWMTTPSPWPISNYGVEVDPDGVWSEWDPYNPPAGFYLVNYNGDFTPYLDGSGYVFTPSTSFSLMSPANNNPVVDVR